MPIKQIAINGTGIVFGLGTDGKLYRFDFQLKQWLSLEE